jgi:hypothetical protein
MHGHCYTGCTHHGLHSAHSQLQPAGAGGCSGLLQQHLPRLQGAPPLQHGEHPCSQVPRVFQPAYHPHTQVTPRWGTGAQAERRMKQHASKSPTNTALAHHSVCELSRRVAVQHWQCDMLLAHPDAHRRTGWGQQMARPHAGVATLGRPTCSVPPADCHFREITAIPVVPLFFVYNHGLLG